MSLSAALYSDLIGKPFVDGARGPEAFDCWGVLQAIVRRMGGNPTDFPSDPALLQQAISDEWQPLERHEIQPGDAILLRSPDPAYVWHVAVVLDGSKMLHTRAGVGVCTERFDYPLHARRIAGFYRFRGRHL